jgi:hypothetical protein
MGRTRTSPSLRVPGEPEVESRGCDMPGCGHAGEYRAPRGRLELSSYYWFCLDHVREYNASWNYYAGMSEAEVEQHIRSDTTWQRPSWPFGVWRGDMRHGHRRRFDDPFGVFGEEADAARTEGQRAWDRRQQSARSEEEKALAVMQLSGPVTVAVIKSRYKELVKRHHPDANGGDRASEERLKVINQAYSTLMSRGREA